MDGRDATGGESASDHAQCRRSQSPSTRHAARRVLKLRASPSGRRDRCASRHQSPVLKAYAQEHLADPDVAIELPTGSGKPLVGALIADWRRLHDGGVSAFACTTRKLAMQAHAKAVGYGIEAVLLTGSHLAWPPADGVRGLAGNATIVTTYSSIFNSSRPHAELARPRRRSWRGGVRRSAGQRSSRARLSVTPTALS